MDPIQKDSLGWELLQLDYVVPMDLKGDSLSIHLFNNEVDPTYFDDLHIIRKNTE